MRKNEAPLATTTTTIAERILSEYFGGPVRLGEGRDLGGSARSKVLRFLVLNGPASVPASVIVKQSNQQPFDPDGENEAAWMLFNDWTSLQFVRELTASMPLAPVFYGGERGAGLFVMEDLGQAPRLDHLLLDSDASAAEAGLLAYARAHGRLHALAMGRQQEYLRLRESLGPARPLSDYYTYTWLFPALRSIAEKLAVPLQAGIDEELASLAAHLVNPGPFLTFVQSDAAPDNCLLLEDGLWLIDFEASRYTHALLEGAYCRMPFPTCWCVYRLPDKLMRRIEAAYRAELARECHAAADDTLFYPAIVEACITWALNFHATMRPLEKMLERDSHLVALTDRQRFLLYIQAAAHASEEFNHLRATGTTLRAIAQRLAALWPDAIDPPYYPAFG